MYGPQTIKPLPLSTWCLCHDRLLDRLVENKNPCLTLSMKSQMVNRDPYQNFFIFDVLICFVVYWIYNIDLQYLHLCPSGENVNIYNKPNPKLSSLKWWTGFSPFFHGRKWMGNWGYIPTYKAYNLQSHLKMVGDHLVHPWSLTARPWEPW